MNKQEALNEFLKSLRISVRQAAVYPRDHPYFKKYIDDLRAKLEALFAFLKPLKLSVAPRHLVVENKPLEGEDYFRELAEILHYRKVKSLTFMDGITDKEMINFLAVVSRTPKDIEAGGGVEALLNEEGLDCIKVEELDYSELL